MPSCLVKSHVFHVSGHWYYWYNTGLKKINKDFPFQLIVYAILITWLDSDERPAFSLEGKWLPFFWGGGLVDAAACSGRQHFPRYLQNHIVGDGKGWWRGGRVWLYLSGRAWQSRVAHQAHPRCSPCFPCACGWCETCKATGACHGWKSALAHNDLKRPSYTAPLPPLESNKKQKTKNTFE